MFGKLEEPYQKGDDWIEFIFLVAIPSEIESKMESELLELYDDIFRIAGEPSLKEALRAVETETEFLSFSKSKEYFNEFLIIFAVFVMAAYIFQMFLGWQQLKDFNKTYTMLRRLGRVAIGRKSGRIKSGTIVMFAVDENGRVLKASKMQGVTILARFQNMDDYVGEDIHYFDKYNPLVRKENKLMQSAIEDARKVYLWHGGRY